MSRSDFEKFICAIVTYNDSCAAISSVKMLLGLGFPAPSISVIENGSQQTHKDVIKEKCLSIGFNMFDIKVNNGWGGAINWYVNLLASDHKDKILLIQAHDAIFHQLDIAEVSKAFEDPKLIFASPSYQIPSSSYYTLLKSFHEKPIRKTGYILIGQQTAFFAKVKYLKSIKYDEEFWVYGGEYEIGLRASSLGYRTYQLEQNIIENPGSSFSSLYSYLSYKLNSMYYAFKAKGLYGLAARGSVLAVNVISLLISKEYIKSLYLLKIIMYSVANPGRGHRTYVKSKGLQKAFGIHPLNF
jgi:GT2 family glycosyltransferase